MEIASSRSFDSAAKNAAPLRTLLAMTNALVHALFFPECVSIPQIVTTSFFVICDFAESAARTGCK